MSTHLITIKGFQFSGISAGIKQTGKPDLALIYSEVPALVVGSFTTSKVQAAPVKISRKNIRSGLCRAVVVNSGNANACTGQQGLKDAEAMVRETARLLKIPQNQVLVSSTGKIGVRLPIDKILKKIPEVVKDLSPNNFEKSAQAILTTDHRPKIAIRRGSLNGKYYAVAGFAKGAGMIEPHMKVETGYHSVTSPQNMEKLPRWGVRGGESGFSPRLKPMHLALPVRGGLNKHATMLAYLMTDIAIDPKLLQIIFENCVEETFNRVTVDGDMSTNDTALLLANGLAGNKIFNPKTRECRQFAEHVYEVMDHLAREMVRDGEGATKCVRIEVKGARNTEEARKMAYTVGNSPLVKTSFFGEDPNWGRIMGALGRSKVVLDPECVDIFYGSVCVARHGVSTGPAQDKKAKQVMQKKEFTVTLHCHLGQGSFGIYASDLTLDYVKLNSCYRS